MLRRTIGKTADKFSIGTIAKETIEEKLAEEQVFKMRLLIDRMFGVGPALPRVEKKRKKVKNQEAVNVWKAYEQAESNSKDYEPLVVIKRNRSKPLVLVGAEHFVSLHKK